MICSHTSQYKYGKYKQKVSFFLEHTPVACKDRFNQPWEGKKLFLTQDIVTVSSVSVSQGGSPGDQLVVSSFSKSERPHGASPSVHIHRSGERAPPFLPVPYASPVKLSTLLWQLHYHRYLRLVSCRQIKFVWAANKPNVSQSTRRAGERVQTSAGAILGFQVAK